MAEEIVAHPRVGDEQVGALQAGQVEGLAGCGASDAVQRELGAERREWSMAQGRVKDEVLVDLVGDDEDAVSGADLAHRPELVLGPHIAGGLCGWLRMKILVFGWMAASNVRASNR